jgi:hypothetical protein
MDQDADKRKPGDQKRLQARSLCMLRPSLQPAGPPSQAGNARNPRQQLDRMACFHDALQDSASYSRLTIPSSAGLSKASLQETWRTAPVSGMLVPNPPVGVSK